MAKKPKIVIVPTAAQLKDLHPSHNGMSHMKRFSTAIYGGGRIATKLAHFDSLQECVEECKVVIDNLKYDDRFHPNHRHSLQTSVASIEHNLKGLRILFTSPVNKNRCLAQTNDELVDPTPINTATGDIQSSGVLELTADI